MNKNPAQLGTYRWLKGGRRGLEGYLYIAHRISGLVLLAFLSLHVFVSSSRLFGEQTWVRIMETTHSPLIRLAEFAVFVAFVFHALNGLRLAAIETGFFIGRPEAPVFPYRGSISKQRPLTIAMMALAGLLIVIGGFEFLRLSM